MTEDKEIYFVVEEQIAQEFPVEGRRGGGDIGGGWGERQRSRREAIVAYEQKKRVGIKASVLKAQMQEMVQVVNEVFAEDSQEMTSEESGRLRLDEITLSVQVNAKGELGILGTGGELGGSGGITLKFVRPK